MQWVFQHEFITAFPALAVAAVPDPPPAARLLLFNDVLAARLGLTRGAQGDAALAQQLGGGAVPPGARPAALAYAGHQFGHLNPELGDGRAHLLGEIVAPDGRRFDLQLKGSGATPFSRGGDGKAALGPVLREYLISQAMAALNIPTTRALAVVTTGEGVWRDRPLPGAVLTRVAASHLRIGTMIHAAMTMPPDDIRALARYALARHYPGAADANDPATALLDAVMTSSARLVAAWMGVGFVHGVMNTDNVTLSGETIDYGPCAFVDAYASGAVYSSIDYAGRYAFANQPRVMQWNMARLAEALLPAMGDDIDASIAAANAMIGTFPAKFERALSDVMAPKLGFASPVDDNSAATATRSLALANQLFAAIDGQGVDFTTLFRAIALACGGDGAELRRLAEGTPSLAQWNVAWSAAISADGGPSSQRAARAMMLSPAIIPRNHLVEAALTDAVDLGDMAAYMALLAAVQSPFDARDADDPLTQPPPTDTPPMVTFCGT